MTTPTSQPHDRRVRDTLISLAVVELVAILLLLWMFRHPAAATTPCPTPDSGTSSSSNGGGGGPGSGTRAGSNDGPAVGGAESMAGTADSGGTKPVAAAGSAPDAGTGAADTAGTPAPNVPATPPAATDAKPATAAADPQPLSHGAGGTAAPETSNASPVKSSRDFANDASGLPHYPGAIPGSIASATSDGSTAGVAPGSGAVFTTNDPFETVTAWYKSHLSGDWDVDRAPAPGADIVMFTPHGANPRNLGVVLLHAPGKATAIVDQAGG